MIYDSQEYDNDIVSEISIKSLMAELDIVKTENHQLYVGLAKMQKELLQCDTAARLEADKLVARIKAIHVSTSWRLTKPLRVMMRGVRRVL
ncbi:MAG: hypothetical protein ACI84R_001670 [Candidatus Azotimanducaceae bacterium]|jgi:hypothetical protein